jgi:hypothetical protein
LPTISGFESFGPRVEPLETAILLQILLSKIYPDLSRCDTQAPVAAVDDG